MRELGRPLAQTRVGSLFTLFFRSPGTITSWDDIKDADVEQFGRYFPGMLGRGIYLAPSQFEAGFVSFAHSEAEIDATLTAARAALAEALA